MLTVVVGALGEPPPPRSSRRLGGLNLLLALREGRPGFPISVAQGSGEEG